MAEFTEKPGSGDADTQRELTGTGSVSNGDCGLTSELAGSTGPDNPSESKPGIPRKASIIKVGTHRAIVFYPPLSLSVYRDDDEKDAGNLFALMHPTL